MKGGVTELVPEVNHSSSVYKVSPKRERIEPRHEMTPENDPRSI